MDPVEVFGHRGPARPTPIGELIARIGKRLDRAFDDALAEVGGNRPAWLILLAIKTGAGRTQSAIAERVGISGPTLIHHLDRLESAGLVNRARDTTNRRVLNVTLTTAGERAFLRLREAAAGFDGRLHRGITDEQMSDLRRWLAVIGANIEPESTSMQPSDAGRDGVVGSRPDSGLERRKK
jgi:MarR family transcriptional regulator, transcriptional regulator for hemolysin